jgi:hypothetical protein
MGLTTAQFQPFICNEQLRYILATYKKEPKKLKKENYKKEITL